MSETLSDIGRFRHDLRTPLNHLLGYCELLLEDDSVPAEFRPELDHIRSVGRELLEAISTHLDENRLHAQPLDLPRLRQELRTPIDQIRGCSRGLEQRARRGDAGHLLVDLLRIQQAAAAWWSLLEAGLQPRGDPTLSTKVRSGLATGPAVTFITPRPEQHDPATGGRILVVDDDPANCDILARYLQRDGCDVVTESDGLAALERLQAGGGNFDLILLDLLMPGLNGYEVLLRLKRDAALSDLPVLIISGLDLEHGIARCIEAGAEDYLTKPFNPTLLRARLRSCLEKKRLRDQERTLAAGLRAEQQRSEQLLLNVLPATIAARLKTGETNLVDATDDATVLFADLVGFTELAATLPAPATVQLLDEIFCAFDELAEHHRVTKIKTIGDAWMAVSGVPESRVDHATAAADLALNLTAFCAGFASRTGHSVVLRIGIHSGPVVAGIIGRHRFSYDLWGDTVNTASRMESHGAPGRIHVSSALRNRLAGTHRFEARGTIPIKGKGEMSTWFLLGRHHDDR